MVSRSMRSALLVLPLVAACGSGSKSSPTTADAAAGAADSSSTADAALPPSPPSTLARWLVGAESDADVSPTGPGIVLMGGGSDVDAAFVWMSGFAAGGDMVILRTSGSDGYNDYLFEDIGGFDSVETLLVNSRALADDPYVGWVLDHAEAIFLAGGDQATYMDYWSSSKVSAALSGAWQRNAVIGGTSAGCAVMGSMVFTAENDTVYSDEALANPYNHYMTLAAGYIAPPPLGRVMTDSHFHERDRLGRLVTFVARMIVDGDLANPIGLGIDEATALLIDQSGAGTVVGSGSVYAVIPTAAPELCVAEQALEFESVPVHKLSAGDTITFPAGNTTVSATPVSASAGALMPADPY